MNKRTWMIQGALALFAWVCIGLGLAQAGVIVPVDPSKHLPINNSSVTVSILKNGVDVTDIWLPEPEQSVDIIVKTGGVAVTPSSMNLVPPPASIVFDGTTNPFLNVTTLTTSAYRGQCTNSGPTDDL